MLEEINERLPKRLKIDDGIKFLILTKWTVNRFQILEMKKMVKHMLKSYQQPNSTGKHVTIRKYYQF